MGLDPKVVQEKLGHPSVGITLGIYSHVSGEVHRSAAGELAAAMFGDTGTSSGGGV